MALIYVKSTTGNNANSGADWANAKATLVGADAIDAAGDTIYVSQAHAENTVGAVNLNFSGALGNPTKVICVDDSANPPTAVATTATVTSNGGLAFAGGSLYCYGITFDSSGAASLGLNVGNSNHHQVYENCSFLVNATGAGSNFRCGVNSAAQQSVTLINCSVKFTNIAQVFSICARTHWKGGSIVVASTTPTVLFGSWLTQAAELLCENVNFANFTTGFKLTNAPPTDANCIIRNCELPAMWAGTLLNTAFAQTGRAEMYNCSQSPTNYHLWVEDFSGSIRDEITVVRTGGATDGTTPISWKMVSSANPIYPWHGLATPLVVYDNTTTGSPVTVTAHFIHDSVTAMTDGEIALEVSYLGTGTAPIGTRITDLKADIITTAANHASSSEVWGGGLTNPNEQQLSVTFTPQLKGRYLMKVILYKASKTVYLCPKFEVSIVKSDSDEYQVPGGPYVLDRSTDQYMIPADNGYSEGTYLIGTGFTGLTPLQQAQYYYVL